MYGMYFDIWYLVLVVPCIILSIVSQGIVKTTYKKYSNRSNHKGITGAEAAKIMLNFQSINGVSVVKTQGTLTDNYNPKTDVISLSEGVYNQATIASIGIACHEAGHAVQHKQGYLPVMLRTAVVPVVSFFSKAWFFIVLLGILLNYGILIDIGVLLFGGITLFYLIQLPVEINASKRAVAAISETGICNQEELVGVRRVLRAAAFTYIAAFAVTLAQFLRLIMRYKKGSR